MRIAADYTTRANYQENYRKANRAAINARKREWRKAKKTATSLKAEEKDSALVLAGSERVAGLDC